MKCFWKQMRNPESFDIFHNYAVRTPLHHEAALPRKITVITKPTIECHQMISNLPNFRRLTVVLEWLLQHLFWQPWINNLFRQKCFPFCIPYAESAQKAMWLWLQHNVNLLLSSFVYTHCILNSYVPFHNCITSHFTKLSVLYRWMSILLCRPTQWPLYALYMWLNCLFNVSYTLSFVSLWSNFH